MKNMVDMGEYVFTLTASREGVYLPGFGGTALMKKVFKSQGGSPLWELSVSFLCIPARIEVATKDTGLTWFRVWEDGFA